MSSAVAVSKSRSVATRMIDVLTSQANTGAQCQRTGNRPGLQP